MIRKLWLGLILALFACVLASGTPSHATKCRRLTVWIADDPYFSHPICMDLPVDAPVAAPAADLIVHSLLSR